MKYKINKKTLFLIMAIFVIISIILVMSYNHLHSNRIDISYQNVEKSEVIDESEKTFIIDISEADSNITPENNESINNVNINDNGSNKNNSNNSNNNVNTDNNKLPYYIRVNCSTQVVTIYSKDAQGDYNNAYKSMVCSTGIHTPKSGTYSIPGRWRWGLLQGNVYGQYVTKITGNILFHSVPYQKQDPSTLEYWEYDKLGTDASLGCVRLRVQDAKWIYENCANGTKVEFYSGSNPDPLAKPSYKKITDYPDYLRNWDPTDPNPSNPWFTYKETGSAEKDKVESEGKNEVMNEVVAEPVNEVTNGTGNGATNESVNGAANETANGTTNETGSKMENEVMNQLGNEV